MSAGMVELDGATTTTRSPRRTPSRCSQAPMRMLAAPSCRCVSVAVLVDTAALSGKRDAAVAMRLCSRSMSGLSPLWRLAAAQRGEAPAESGAAGGEEDQVPGTQPVGVVEFGQPDEGVGAARVAEVVGVDAAFRRDAQDVEEPFVHPP